MMEIRATSIIVNPTSRTTICGHGYSNDCSPPNLERDFLEINAVLFTDRKLSVLLLSFDLLFVGPDLENAITEYVQAKDASIRCFLFASHTHNAPSVDPSRPKLGALDRDYLRNIKHAACEVIDNLLMQSGSSFTIKSRNAMANSSVNRRGYRFQLSKRGVKQVGPYIKPSFFGKRNELVLNWTLLDSNSKPIAIIWTYASHPVGLRDSVSSHYPGFIRSQFRLCSTSRIPVLFFQGFSGDVRPRITSYVGLKEWIWYGYEFSDFTDRTYQTWCDCLWRVICGGREFGRETVSSVHYAEARMPLSAIFKGTSEKPGENICCKRLGLGKSLQIISVSAEVFSNYQSLLPRNVVGIGCEGNVFGYLPTKMAIHQGGYEPDWSRELFGLTSNYRDDVEERFRWLLSELA